MLNIKKNNKSVILLPDLPTIFLIVGISIYFFLLLFIPSMIKYWAISLVIVNIIYIFFIKDKIKENFYLNIDFVLFFWILFVISSFLSLIMTESNFSDGLKFVIGMMLSILNYIFLVSNNKWSRLLIRILTLISIFFLIGSVIQLIAPDLILKFNYLHLSDSLYQGTLEFYKNGSLNGITYQTGINGFLLSYLMGIILSHIYVADSLYKKVLLILSYIFVFYLLFLTNRRGFILFNALILFIIIFKMTKNKYKAIAIISAVLLTILIFLLTTETGLNIVNRTLNQQDFSTGRLGMIKIMWADFLERPILGNGVYTTIDVVDFYHGHNIYFQVLRENGIIGFVFLIVALLGALVKTSINLSRFSENKGKTFVLMISFYFQLFFLMWGGTESPLYGTYPVFFYFLALAMNKSIEGKNYN